MHVPASTSGEEIQIKCTLCSTISQKSNFIFEHQILKNGNDEILFFNEFKTENVSKMNDVTIINGILGNYSENIFNTALIESSKYNKLNEFIINGIFDGIINIKINLINKRLFLLDYSLNCSLINNSEGKSEIYCGTGDKFYKKIKCVDENVIIEYDNEDKKKENENLESEMGIIEKEINETDSEKIELDNGNEKSDEIGNNENQKYGSDKKGSDENKSDINDKGYKGISDENNSDTNDKENKDISDENNTNTYENKYEGISDQYINDTIDNGYNEVNVENNSDINNNKYNGVSDQNYSDTENNKYYYVSDANYSDINDKKYNGESNQNYSVCNVMQAFFFLACCRLSYITGKYYLLSPVIRGNM